MNPYKTKAVEAWKTPVNKTEVQSFLGIVNYQGKFIKDYSKIAKPLSELTKNKPFLSIDEEKKLFKALKKLS